MSEWSYLLSDEGAAQRQAVRRIEMATPRVSIYCTGNALSNAAAGEMFSHQDDPWLFGSFEPLSRLLERTGELHWGFFDSYPVGDGTAVSCGKQSAQYLIGERVIDGVEAQFSDETRGRYRFDCGACAFVRTWKSESLRLPITVLAQREVREISLRGMVDMVDALSPLAKPPGC